MDELIAGYHRFRATQWPQERTRFEALAAEGQRPHTMVVGCSDSRVDPQMIFDARPGELFVVRNVANLVPPYAPDAAYHGTSAALEFAVRALGVRRLVVLGHGLCGGVLALLEGPPAMVGDFVPQWMAIAATARAEALQAPPEARQEACEQAVVRHSIANLLTFPWIRDGAESGSLSMQGCHFDVRTGVLKRLGRDGVFAAVPVEPPDRL
jgi:carbonic anhydrase